jgi:hypothetical protein
MTQRNCLVLVTLRHNIVLAGDVELARREFSTLLNTTSLEAINTAAFALDLPPLSLLPRVVSQRIVRHARNATPFGFLAQATVDQIQRLVLCSAFAQEVVLKTSAATFDTLPPHLVQAHGTGVFTAIPLNALFEYSSQLADRPGGVGKQLDGLLEYLHGRGSKVSHAYSGAVSSKKTTLSLSHDLHIYKAKFFPRMVRFLLNTFAPTPAGGVLLDPFSGSGTALLEGSALGYESFGIDVDPISALISNSKVRPFTTDRADTVHYLTSVLDDLSAPPLFQKQSVRKAAARALPSELRAKLARRDGKEKTNFLCEIEDDLATIEGIARRHSREATPGILDVLLSDAVTKKIRYRFVGVGNGRYTIEVVKQRVVDRLREKLEGCLALCEAFEWLETRCAVNFASATARCADASEPGCLAAEKAFDVCLTSPPYLPASSGREHYAASRALALSVTGLSSEWGQSSNRFVGVPERSDRATFDTSTLTPSGQALLKYLLSDTDRSDPQRDAMRFERKAIPTWCYLVDVERFLKLLRAKARPNAVCLFVVASQHVFYSHRKQQLAKQAGEDGSGSVEYVAKGRDLYGEIASRAGWDFAEEVTVELSKSATSVARPRSSEEYAESVLVLRPSAIPTEKRERRRGVGVATT